VGVNHIHYAAGVDMFRNVISGILFGDGRQVWLYSAVALLSAGVLAMTLGGGAVWSVITGNRFVQMVGRASYGGYVYHALCVTEVRALLHGVFDSGPGMPGKLEFGFAVFALALPATIVLSLLSYHYVEHPLIAAVSRRLTARTSAAG